MNIKVKTSPSIPLNPRIQVSRTQHEFETNTYLPSNHNTNYLLYMKKKPVSLVASLHQNMIQFNVISATWRHSIHVHMG